jgi:hypothetical protein
MHWKQASNVRNACVCIYLTKLLWAMCMIWVGDILVWRWCHIFQHSTTCSVLTVQLLILSVFSPFSHFVNLFSFANVTFPYFSVSSSSSEHLPRSSHTCMYCMCIFICWWPDCAWLLTRVTVVVVSCNCVKHCTFYVSIMKYGLRFHVQGLDIIL